MLARFLALMVFYSLCTQGERGLLLQDLSQCTSDLILETYAADLFGIIYCFLMDGVSILIPQHSGPFVVCHCWSIDVCVLTFAWKKIKQYMKDVMEKCLYDNPVENNNICVTLRMQPKKLKNK